MTCACNCGNNSLLIPLKFFLCELVCTTYLSVNFFGNHLFLAVPNKFVCIFLFCGVLVKQTKLFFDMNDVVKF